MSDTNPGVEIARRLDATLTESIDTATIVFANVGPPPVPGELQQMEPSIQLSVTQWAKLVGDTARLCGYIRGAEDA